MFQTIDTYPFLAPVQEAWQDIRKEYEVACKHLTPWPERYLYNEGWQAFGLTFMGEQLPEGIAKCPETWRIIKDIPGLFIAGFSVLKPKTTIYPHRGYTATVWRSHLGIICPEGAWIEVGGERKSWVEGEMFVFDDTIEHSAANESDQDRVIFLLDFLKH